MEKSTEDAKPHPSELLEFHNLPFTPTSLPNEKPHVRHFEGEIPSSESTNGSLFNYLPRRGSVAQTGADSERHMSLLQALRAYPKAIAWSCMISMAIIMEGYDTALVSSLYAFPQFQRSYGVPAGNGAYQIPTHWQNSLSNGSTAGSVVGLFANGILTEYFGYRKTMIGALIALASFIPLTFFAFNLPTLLAGQILCGISWGVFSTLTTTYAAEIMPLTLRGYLTANVNTCWLLGQIIAAGALRGFVDMQSNWSYRIPFGLQWFWILFILVGATMAPESPWWLIKKDRADEAKRVLHRLTQRKFGLDVESIVAMMEHTNEAEKKMSSGKGNDLSYLECLRGANRRRTEIACMTFMIQNLSGLPIIAFETYFYQQIGFDQTFSFDLSIGMQGVALLGATSALILMKYFGRRRLYLIGLGVQFTILLIAGVINVFKETHQTLWATASLLIFFIFVFDCALGPITYTLVAEIPSTRLRVKTVVLARASYNVCALITNVLQQHMLNPLDWNWRGKTCFFWAGSCFFCFIYCFWRLPETKGLTYLELDILFEKVAPARKFQKFQKTLASTGYFTAGDEGLNSPNWREPAR